MNDPKIVHCAVTISYRSDDGYSYKAKMATIKGLPNPALPLIEALEELSRLTALFGFEDEALQAFNAARERVAKWRSERETTPQ